MNILFTAFYFNGYHGSMMHVCEIAKYLSSKGHKCYCASFSIKKEVKEYAKSIGLDVYDVMDLPIDKEYDIVWAYHFPLFPYLLDRGLKYKKVHVGCLGLKVPLEVPSVLYKECNMLSVMCQRSKEILVADYGIKEDDVYVLKNLLPDEFCNVDINLSVNPQRIAVVSNHPPQEVVELPLFLRGIEFDFYGSKSGNYKPITPEILSKYDVIISIGKTVQYALGMGIPVYNYDYFGGSGYVTLENIDKEEHHNFCGKSFCRKLSSEEIAKEILEGFSKVVEQTQKLKKIAVERYLLSENIDKIMNILEKSPDVVIKDSPENKFYIRHCLFTVEQSQIMMKAARRYKKCKKIIIILSILLLLMILLLIAILVR